MPKLDAPLLRINRRGYVVRSSLLNESVVTLHACSRPECALHPMWRPGQRRAWGPVSGGHLRPYASSSLCHRCGLGDRLVECSVDEARSRQTGSRQTDRWTARQMDIQLDRWTGREIAGQGVGATHGREREVDRRAGGWVGWGGSHGVAPQISRAVTALCNCSMPLRCSLHAPPGQKGGAGGSS